MHQNKFLEPEAFLSRGGSSPSMSFQDEESEIWRKAPSDVKEFQRNTLSQGKRQQEECSNELLQELSLQATPSSVSLNPAFRKTDRPVLDIDVNSSDIFYPINLAEESDSGMRIGRPTVKQNFNVNILNKLSVFLGVRNDNRNYQNDSNAVSAFVKTKSKTQEKLRELCGFSEGSTVEQFDRSKVRKDMMYCTSKWIVPQILACSKSSIASKLNEIQSLSALQDIIISPEVKADHRRN